MKPLPPLVTALACLALAGPAAAQRGHWGGDGWGPSPWDSEPRIAPYPGRTTGHDREGHVEVSRFIADGDVAAQFGHGAIEVQPAEADQSDDRERATYEAAVIDQLVQAGYETAGSSGAAGQVAELTITHSELEPPEAKHKPVSGEMAVGVSNRGTMTGMALNIDLRKPAKALLGTRLVARIKDRASGAVLWEGRADIATRDGDEHWSDQAIAAKLAGALFGGFPGKSGESFTVR